MTKMARVASFVGLVGLSLAIGMLGAVSTAQAFTTDDQPAAILIWPKIVVDPSGLLGGPPTDTVIQLSNTSSSQTRAHCFYVNANSHCAAPGPTSTVCATSAQCPITGGGVSACVPGWSETDFDIVLTAEQPLGWSASGGLRISDLPFPSPGTCAFTGVPCSASSQFCTCNLHNGGSNAGTGIPPTPESPFTGSLTCIQFTNGINPVPDSTTNSLKGEATIETLRSSGTPGLAKYNAVGLQGTGVATSNVCAGGSNNGQSCSIATAAADCPGGVCLTDSNVLALGSTSGQFQACPTTLILDHFFDDADPLDPTPLDGDLTSTDLTLVPCGNDFLRQVPGNVTAQFLVFNEFEQRFSASRSVDCFLETPISNIDTRIRTRSIFNFNVMGTLVGQTRIRGVAPANSTTGRGLVGVARLSLSGGGESAYNLFQSGTPDFTITPPDVITIP